MGKSLYCPCCGYDFRKKKWLAESDILLRRYDKKEYRLLKSLFEVCKKYEVIEDRDVYYFLKGISVAEKDEIFEGIKKFFKSNHQTKGINYCKHIILNVSKNRKFTEERLLKTIGAKSEPLKDE